MKMYSFFLNISSKYFGSFSDIEESSSDTLPSPHQFLIGLITIKNLVPKKSEGFEPPEAMSSLETTINPAVLLSKR